MPKSMKPLAHSTFTPFLAFSLLAVSALLAACRTPTPPFRTVVFTRDDLTYEDVWNATVVALANVFPLQVANRNERFVVTDYEYDESAGESYRWKATARIEKIADFWAVRVSTETERLVLRGWEPVGIDDRTSMWLTQRIDQWIYAEKGPPPKDESMEILERSPER